MITSQSMPAWASVNRSKISYKMLDFRIFWWWVEFTVTHPFQPIFRAKWIFIATRLRLNVYCIFSVGDIPLDNSACKLWQSPGHCECTPDQESQKTEGLLFCGFLGNSRWRWMKFRCSVCDFITPFKLALSHFQVSIAVTFHFKLTSFNKESIEAYLNL